jgi:hypothetical protein
LACGLHTGDAESDDAEARDAERAREARDADSAGGRSSGPPAGVLEAGECVLEAEGEGDFGEATFGEAMGLVAARLGGRRAGTGRVLCIQGDGGAASSPETTAASFSSF